MNLKVGDRVKILRASTKEEDDTLWMNCWVWQMSFTIGKVATIENINGFGVRFKERKKDSHFDYRFPPFVLQKVNEQMLFSFMIE